MGFISAGDSYNQRCDQALKGLSGITKIVDDVLIASKTYDTHKKDVLISEMLRRTQYHFKSKDDVRPSQS